MSLPVLGSFSGGGFLIVQMDADGSPVWARHLLTASTPWGALSSTSGHVYAAISSTSDVALLPTPAEVPNSGGFDLLLLDLDPATGADLSRYTTTSGTRDEYVTALRSDASGAYVGGFFTSTSFTFATRTMSAVGLISSFAVKVTPTGFVPWARAFGGSTTSVLTALAVATTGHVYVAGTYTSTDFQFGTSTLPAPSGAGASYVAVLSGGSGQPQWARSFEAVGPAATTRILEMSTSSTSIVLLGEFAGDLTVDIGWPTLQSLSDTADAFLLSFSPLGDLEASYKFGSDVRVEVHDVHMLSSGDVAVALGFEGLLVLDRFDRVLGSETRLALGGTDAYIAVLAPQGQSYVRLWDRSFGTIDSETGYRLASFPGRLVAAVRRYQDGPTPFEPYHPTGTSFLVSLGL